MIDRITRGWDFAKLSLRVLRNDQSLALFPIISTICIVIAVAAIGIPGYLAVGVDQHSPAVFVLGALLAFVSTFLTIFFNVALVSCAARSFDGADTTVGEGIAAASARAGIIFRWALLATTVGLALRLLEERLPLAGRIATWLVGAAWAIATFFVVPVIAFEEVGPVDAVKRSASIVRARWGEALAGDIGIGFAVMLAMLVVAAPLALVGMLLMSAALPLAVLLWTMAALVFIAGSVLSTTLTQIFNVALYTYAKTGTAPGGFQEGQLSTAFAKK